MSIASYGALLDALRGVHWPARRLVRDAAAGTHRSRMRGSSAEFTEYRPYRQGDDPRRLDWRLLGRSDRAYIRLATDRAIQPTLLALDASASMDFPSGIETKWTQARRIAVGLAALAHGDGDPVGVIIPGGAASRVLAPRSRRGVVSEIARTLDDVRPMGDAPLAPALTTVPKGARLVILSDFLGDEPELLRTVRGHLATGSEVHGVHIVASAELSPPGRGILAVDPEDAQLSRPLVAESYVAYVESFRAWREATAASWRAAGATFTLATSEEPAAHAVRRIVGAGGGSP